MHRKKIHFNEIVYKIIPYGKRKGEKVLLKDDYQTKTSREVSIGNTLEDIQNPKYNKNLLNRLKEGYTKINGCEIEFISVNPITEHGFTNYRFEE
tara:strand:+ start:425 stop:709 length:285 start_codon:yes stop_codon:yes gene_type:complete